MPIGPFKDFEECVTAMTGKVADPKAYCGALERDATKSAPGTVDKQFSVVHKNDERRLTYSIVYEPNVTDAHQDFATPAEIEKAAHGFMEEYALMQGATGIDHARDTTPAQVVVVESYIAPVDFQLGGQAVKKGSWIMVMKIHDDRIWEAVKSGRYTGYSLEGLAERVPVL